MSTLIELLPAFFPLKLWLCYVMPPWWVRMASACR